MFLRVVYQVVMCEQGRFKAQNPHFILCEFWANYFDFIIVQLILWQEIIFHKVSTIEEN